MTALATATVELSLCAADLCFAPGPSVALPCFGRYQTLSRIAEGGMGMVFRGHDPETGRQVAIKVIRPAQGASPFVVRKFLNEGRITSQLEHPNIIPVHDVGVTRDGHLFIVMKLVQGRDLHELLARGGWPLDRLLDVFDKVCEALIFAHAMGVIHRDLKPANVMIGRFGEVHVMDWGIAKRLGASEAPPSGHASSDALTTSEGDLLGTPAYMAPEQAAGDLTQIDARTDVYALGAMLYEILTGTRPYRGDSLIDVLLEVREGRVEPPSERAPERRIPAALESVALVAMARERARRFASVELLREALRAGRQLPPGSEEREKKKRSLEGFR